MLVNKGIDKAIIKYQLLEEYIIANKIIQIHEDDLNPSEIISVTSYWISEKKCCEILSIHINTLRNWCINNKIEKHYKFGLESIIHSNSFAMLNSSRTYTVFINLLELFSFLRIEASFAHYRDFKINLNSNFIFRRYTNW